MLVFTVCPFFNCVLFEDGSEECVDLVEHKESNLLLFKYKIVSLTTTCFLRGQTSLTFKQPFVIESSVGVLAWHLMS